MTTIHELRGYIFTIPKAGTYLMSEFLSQIGSKSTGWHISLNKYLDTLGFDDLTNKQTPSATKKDRPYIGSFRRIPPGHHGFGHFSPLYVPPPLLNNGFKCLCVKRHPKEVLLSEFIDFRYRRSDVAFVSKQNVRNSIEAFETYMEHHAPVIRNICQNFRVLESIATDQNYIDILQGNRFYFLDFKSFLNKESGPILAAQISQFFETGLDDAQARTAWQNALDADNKTKSADAEVDIPRSEFWSEKALSRYQALGFDVLEKQFGY